MGGGGRSAPRVLMLYGSESGTAKRGVTKLADRWKAKGVDVVGVKEGGSVSLASLKSMCDVVIVATSSYGEGDPPSNIASLVLELFRGSRDGTKPLEGLSHAVLGYGASVYETFQNVPRLTDKFLGECGSRRLAMRQEIDECEDTEEQKFATFEAEVLKALQSLPAASTPPVCEWTKPESKILEKTEDDLSVDAFDGGSGATLFMLAGAVAVGAAAYAYWSGLIEI